MMNLLAQMEDNQQTRDEPTAVHSMYQAENYRFGQTNPLVARLRSAFDVCLLS